MSAVSEVSSSVQGITLGELVTASENQYKIPQGRAACCTISAKAVEKMLRGELKGREDLDQVLREGAESYKAMIAASKDVAPEFGMEMGSHLNWAEIGHFFDAYLESGGDLITKEIPTEAQGGYLELLKELEGVREGALGALILVRGEYYALCLREDGVQFFDSHGSRAISGEGSPAFAVRKGSLEEVAELLARRAPHSAEGSNEILCQPLIGTERLFTSPSVEEVFHEVDEGVPEKVSDEIIEKGKKLFKEVSSDDEDEIFYDCPEIDETDYEKRHAFIQDVTEVGTLIIRDHLLPATLKEGAVDQEIIIERVEQWFEGFLPTLFFEKGGKVEEKKADLTFVCQVIGSLTKFVKDYNQARRAIEGKEGSFAPREMHEKVHQVLNQGKMREKLVLDEFATALVNLYEAKEGKGIPRETKEKMVQSISAVLDALIDTVLSPEFSKLLVLGFLDDDQIVGELGALRKEDKIPGEAPKELHEGLTKLVNELIDFGNPRYSSWIATAMLKTHFVNTDGHQVGMVEWGMRFLSKPLFKDEIGVFLKDAFALQKGEANQEEWVKTAHLGVQIIRRYGWTETKISKMGRVEERPDIPETLFGKIVKMAHTIGPKETSRMLSVTSWVMPSVHTFGKSLTENLYTLSQSKPLMRTYTVRYLIGGVLTGEVVKQTRMIPTPISRSPKLQSGIPEALGTRMAGVVGDYLRGYVNQLYLKESPLVSSVVELSVNMVQGFLPEMVATTARDSKALSSTKQEMVVDFYGSLGPFMKDYSLAVQEAKKNPQFGEYAKRGMEDQLVLRALEGVKRGAILTSRDIDKKLGTICELLIRSHSEKVTPLQAQLVRSTAFVLPDVLRGGINLVFSPEMISVLVTNSIEGMMMSGEIPDDLEHQYQTWDEGVLSRWHDSLFDLAKGMVAIGEPEGQVRDAVEKVFGMGATARETLGSFLPNPSSGPSPLLAPRATLQTLEVLERALFTEQREAKIRGVFDPAKRKEREEGLREALVGLTRSPLPLEKIRSVTQGWVGQTAERGAAVIGVAATGFASLSKTLSLQAASGMDGPILQVVKRGVDQALKGMLSSLFPESFCQLFEEKLPEALTLSETAATYLKENPVVKFMDNACENLMIFMKSKDLMRAYIYNYVLTPEFFTHMVQNLEEGKTLSQSQLVKDLPGSLFLDMASFSWVLPGPERNPALAKTPHFVSAKENSMQGLEESHRLFEAVKVSPSLSHFFATLQTWEKEGKITSEQVRGLYNSLENPETFLRNVEGVIDHLKVSRDEKVALIGEAKKGEFPLVFRYLDAVLSSTTPLHTSLFGRKCLSQLKEQFLQSGVSKMNGELIQKMEPLHLASSLDRFMARYPDVIAPIVEKLDSEAPTLKQFLTLFEESAKHESLAPLDKLFLQELVRGFKMESNPVSHANQLFALYEGMQFWDKKTEAIHQDIAEAPNSALFEPQVKSYYQKLGVMLSETLTAPATDKLKLAFTDHFLSRYRSLAQGKAPMQGEVRERSCSAHLTPDSKVGNQHKLALIDAAEKSIVMSGCYFGGEIFTEALERIEKKLEANKEFDVKLIGSEHMLTRENKGKIAEIEKKHPERFMMLVLPEAGYYTSPISKRTCVRTNHAKSLVIDYGRYFEVGGSGLADRWDLEGREKISSEKRPMQPLGFRDADFVFRSEEEQGVGYGLYLEMLSLFPIWGAKDLKERIQSSFDPRFHHVAPPKSGRVAVEGIDFLVNGKVGEAVTFYSTGPDDSHNTFEKDLIQDIDQAKESIHIQHMYFHPSPELLEALKGAARRGVAISIATNRSGEDMPLTHDLFVDLSKMNWKLLFEGQERSHVKIFTFNVANTTYHKKVVMVDQKTVYLGSSNLGEKSLNMHDHEINLRVHSPALGKEVLAQFNHEINPLIRTETETIVKQVQKTRDVKQMVGNRRNRREVVVKQPYTEEVRETITREVVERPALFDEVPSQDVAAFSVDSSLVTATFQKLVLARLL